MTRPNATDEVPPQVLALADDIRRAHADDSVAIAFRQETREPGTEPMVILYLNGDPAIEFRRDDFLDALYVLGCDTIEKGLAQ